HQTTHKNGGGGTRASGNHSKLTISLALLRTGTPDEGAPAGTTIATRGRHMDTPKTSRREFCAHAITFAAVASLIEGCGGGSPTSPSGGGNVPQLSTVSGTASGENVDGQQRSRHAVATT